MAFCCGQLQHENIFYSSIFHKFCLQSLKDYMFFQDSYSVPPCFIFSTAARKMSALAGMPLTDGLINQRKSFRPSKGESSRYHLYSQKSLCLLSSLTATIRQNLCVCAAFSVLLLQSYLRRCFLQTASQPSDRPLWQVFPGTPLFLRIYVMYLYLMRMPDFCQAFYPLYAVFSRLTTLRASSSVGF